MESQDLLTYIKGADCHNRSNPFFAFRPAALDRAASYFSEHFSARLLYAVKTNPESHVITRLRAHGINSFDVASLPEIASICHHFPEAQLYFMHPVKSRHAIRAAYFNYGVRHFSLDTQDELEKILQETQYAKDLCLHLRLAVPNAYAEHSLAGKFGVDLQHAPTLLQKMEQYAERLGVCFHVGTQCMHPDAYRIAMRMAGDTIEHAGVKIHYFNVGGGFPSVYPGMMAPPMIEYFNAIEKEFNKLSHGQDMELIAEPGRAIVAESTSLVVRVELRKGDVLYINDGTYGSLFDAGTPQFIYPVRMLSSQETESTNLQPFRFYGPTCDTLDHMKGPFYLPQEIKEGDYIEIGQIGAYGRTMATNFNGFSHEREVVTINDEPLMTMYNHEQISSEPLEVIAA